MSGPRKNKGIYKNSIDYTEHCKNLHECLSILVFTDPNFLIKNYLSVLFKLF